jgi:L-methionine (R)-S-oxide reductase
MEATIKHKRYERIYLQLTQLLTKTNDSIAQMATISAVLYHKFDYFYWCGFYCLKQGELIVGPYQGTLACQILEQNKGVCWSGILSGKTVIVPDVHQFPGHIACDSQSNSEIVVPVKDIHGKICAVLDADSKSFAAFDEIDAACLEKITGLITY